MHSKLLSVKIKKHLNIIVNCGIGEEQTARIAMATKNLDVLRHVRKHNDTFPRILDNQYHLKDCNPCIIISINISFIYM